MKTITFNTGRKYTANGQQITATLHDDFVVTFFDHARKIDGQIDLTPAMVSEETFHKGHVLAAYDNGNYGSTVRSWSDGTHRNGCNASDATDALISLAEDLALEART